MEEFLCGSPSTISSMDYSIPIFALRYTHNDSNFANCFYQTKKERDDAAQRLTTRNNELFLLLKSKLKNEADCLNIITNGDFYACSSVIILDGETRHFLSTMWVCKYETTLAKIYITEP